jgi:hypothetical protein
VGQLHSNSRTNFPFVVDTVLMLNAQEGYPD